jgi:hypothetical protein
MDRQDGSIVVRQAEARMALQWVFEQIGQREDEVVLT